MKSEAQVLKRLAETTGKLEALTTTLPAEGSGHAATPEQRQEAAALMAIVLILGWVLDADEEVHSVLSLLQAHAPR